MFGGGGFFAELCVGMCVGMSHFMLLNHSIEKCLVRVSFCMLLGAEFTNDEHVCEATGLAGQIYRWLST